MDKKITRRHLLGSAAATFALLWLPPSNASPAVLVVGRVLPGLNADVLDDYLRSLPYNKARQGPSASSSSSLWHLAATGSTDSARVSYATDSQGGVERVEAAAAGFSLATLLEDLAGIPLASTDTGNAVRWVRGIYERGFERWPDASQAELVHHGVRYQMTGSFNSTGFAASLAIEPSD